MKTTYIRFLAEVNENSALALLRIIDSKIQQGVEKVVLLISTPGGTVLHGLSVHNYLKGIPIEVETHNFGSVDSIGVLIFSAGKKRYSVKDARFLLHPVACNLNANLEADKLKEIFDGLQTDLNNISNAIAHSTGQPVADIKKAITDRTTLDPQKAKDFGLVHEIKTELFPLGADIISIF